MMLIATWIYLGLSVLVLLFLAALIVGAPWGELTLGGKWRGALPMKVRLIPLAIDRNHCLLHGHCLGAFRTEFSDALGVFCERHLDRCGL